jgi:superfamily II DNA or RNA helicase
VLDVFRLRGEGELEHLLRADRPELVDDRRGRSRELGLPLLNVGAGRLALRLCAPVVDLVGRVLPAPDQTGGGVGGERGLALQQVDREEVQALAAGRGPALLVLALQRAAVTLSLESFCHSAWRRRGAVLFSSSPLAFRECQERVIDLSSIPLTADHRPVVVFRQHTMLLLSGLTSEMSDEIKTKLTIANPKWLALRRHGGGFVPPNVPKHLVGYAETPHGLAIAPGFGSDAWRIVKELGGAPIFEQGPRAAAPVPFGLECHGLTLRDYQSPVRDALRTTRQAVIVMPCRSGKTRTIIAGMCEAGRPALVLAHNGEAAAEWVREIGEVTGYKAPQLGGGRKDAITGQEPVIVATPWTLARDEAAMRTLAATRRAVIVDEVQKMPAVTYTNVLCFLPVEARWGITGTLKRSDNMIPLTHWWIGPNRVVVDKDEVQDAGHLLMPELCVYQSQVCEHFEGGEYQAIVERVLDDQDRLNQIVLLVAGAVQAEPARQHFIVSLSVSYGQWILEMLRAMLPAVRMEEINGQVKPPSRRKELVADWKDGRIPVVVATTIADESLTLPHLTDVWLVTPTRSAGKIEQRTLRACTPMAGKPAVRVHDLVDPQVTWTRQNPMTREEFTSRPLLGQFKTRFFKVYSSTCQSGLGEGRDLIRSWRNV